LIFLNLAGEDGVMDVDWLSTASSAGNCSSSLLVGEGRASSPEQANKPIVHDWWLIKKLLSIRGSRSYYTLERREPRRLRKKSPNF
jgi:hypothetical protein